MKRFTALLLPLLLFVIAPVRAEYPRPNPYPISWELAFEHDLPKRIAVQPAGATAPKAYWYLKYTVTNKSDKELTFLPVFELLTEDGRVLRSDKNIPPKVFQVIKKTEGDKLMIPSLQVGGELRLGEDEAKESVAIWEEPTPEMGTFAIFVAGLSGEHVTVKPTAKDEKPTTKPSSNGKEKEVILRKTLQLNYLIRGDEFYPGEDEVNKNAEAWVMR